MTGYAWLTLADAASRVGRSERTIRNWVAAGEIRTFLGRVREDALLAADKRMRGRRGRPRKTTNQEIGRER